jgi:hypothetical protein
MSTGKHADGQRADLREQVRRRQVGDPADEAGLAQPDGVAQHVVEREEERHLDHHRQAPGQGIDLVLLVQVHHRLVQLGLDPCRTSS